MGLAKLIEEGKLTEELITNTLDALFLAGEMEICATGRAAAFRHAIADAIVSASGQPGCEVRITCKDLKEAIFVFVVLYSTLEQYDRLDKERSDGLSKIEMTNGSCIVITLEKAVDMPDRV